MEPSTNEDILAATKILVETFQKNTVYQHHLQIRNKLVKHSSITQQIAHIKELEKKYVKSAFLDEAIHAQIEQQLTILREFPLYQAYEQSLSEINGMIEQIKSELNTTFTNLLTNKKG